MADLVKVFVYGTLKRGFPNHRLLGDPPKGFVKFLMTGRTKNKYPLVVATDANIPFVLPLPGKGELVEGEIYEVDQEALSTLDVLEGHPTWYKRTACPIITSDEQQTEVMCDIYCLNNYKKELLTLPLLTSYTQEHSSKYAGPTERSNTANIKEQSQDVKPV